jgi:hypothetical protein
MNIIYEGAERIHFTLVGVGIVLMCNPKARKDWLMLVFVMAGASVATKINEKAFPDGSGAWDLLRADLFSGFGGWIGYMIHKPIGFYLRVIQQNQSQAEHAEC